MKKNDDERKAGSPSVAAGKKRLAAIFALTGVLMTVAGLALGRGSELGVALLQARLFLLVVGFSLALAGLVGLAALARRGAKGRAV